MTMVSVEELTHEQLVEELRRYKLAAGDRVAALVQEAKRNEAAIGPAFAYLQAVWEAERAERDEWGILGLRSLEMRLEKVAARSNLVAQHTGFQAFLEGHPELGGTPAARRRPRPAAPRTGTARAGTVTAS